jgi:hypothetical protein
MMGSAVSNNNTYVPPEVKLSDDEKRTVDNTLRLLADIGPIIQKAQSCGIECSGHETLRNHLHELMTNVKKEFGQFTEPQVY